MERCGEKERKGKKNLGERREKRRERWDRKREKKSEERRGGEKVEGNI